MSQGELASVIRQHAVMGLTAGAIGLIAAAVLAGAWHVSIRNRDQASALELAEAQNQHLREMQLAGAGLAHEIRNPLNVLRGTAQGMSEDCQQTGRQGQSAQRMLDEIDRIVSRLNAFLSFSNLATPEIAPVDAKQIVEEVGALLQHGLEDGKLEIAVDDLPSIRADRTLFRQIVFNLLHNAARATRDSGSVRVEAVRSDRSHLTLEVTDTGLGVSEELRERLFRPYCAGGEGGSGLGLSIVRQLAIAHGWQVGYRPNPDGGSTFWVASIEIAENEGGDEAATDA